MRSSTSPKTCPVWRESAKRSRFRQQHPTCHVCLSRLRCRKLLTFPDAGCGRITSTDRLAVRPGERCFGSGRHARHDGTLPHPGWCPIACIAGTRYGRHLLPANPCRWLLMSAVGAPRYDSPNLPNYAWPGYAAHPNYAALTYPQQYSPSAWPYIGPFYPYPQVPLGWRKVSLEWDDGWWFLDFTDR